MSDRRTGGRVDAVALEIFANLFQAVVDEMAWVILRSAHTTFVKETQDFATALITPDGEVFAAPHELGATPLMGVHMGSILEQVEEWMPGDVVVTNDPYTTSGAVMHLNDVYLLKPVFRDDVLVCFLWVFIHFTDVGGSVPGSINMLSEDIFQEGIRIRPVKLLKRGQVESAVENLIFDNSRIPTLNRGDLTALLAALDKGEGRVCDLLARRGRRAFERAMYATIERTEKLARSVLASIPAGGYDFVEYFEDDYVSNVPVRLQVRVVVSEPGHVKLDFTGSDPAVRAALNLPTGGRRHHPFLSLAVLNFIVTNAEDLHPNGGLLRCVELELPEDSVVNASLPAACGMRFTTAMRVHELVLGALAQAVPGRVPAGGNSELVVTYIATPDEGDKGRVVVANPVQGGSGGGPGLDGVSGVDYSASFLRTVPIEVLESEAPVLVRRFMIRQDSEGAGRFRGGFGVEYALEVLDPMSTVIMRGKDRHRFSAWGLDGGLAGSTGHNDVLAAGGATRDIGKSTVFHPRPGDVCAIASGGGGGFGDPLDRSPDAVLDDVLDDLVSVRRAADTYGVVISGTTVLQPETTELRRRLRTARIAESGFDLGPGRRSWELKWLGVASLLASELPTLPPRLRRRAQSSLYSALADQPDATPISEPVIRAAWKQVRAGFDGTA